MVEMIMVTLVITMLMVMMMMLITANMCLLLPGMLAFHTHINLFNPLNCPLV